MRLTPQREFFIRARLDVFKKHHACADYEDSHGPDMEALLEEIDALRTDLKSQELVLLTAFGEEVND